jgi:hypothetical protein
LLFDNVWPRALVRDHRWSIVMALMPRVRPRPQPLLDDDREREGAAMQDQVRPGEMACLGRALQTDSMAAQPE